MLGLTCVVGGLGSRRAIRATCTIFVSSVMMHVLRSFRPLESPLVPWLTPAASSVAKHGHKH